MMEYNQIISLWQGEKPFSDPELDCVTEHFMASEGDGILRLTDVTEPTITCYPASGKGPHPAVVVCPGGGYGILAWNHEGTDICAMLNQAGFTAFLLKYRCPKRRAAARADLARALRLIRFYSAEWNVFGYKLGIIGFSAGAHLCAVTSAPSDPVPYEPQDKIDKLSCRPDYTALIYPAYLADATTLALAPEFKIDSSVPPCFVLQTENDPVQVENALAWYWNLKKANVSCEMHLYPTGGHGYGLLRTGEPVADWASLVCPWFRRQTGVC